MRALFRSACGILSRILSRVANFTLSAPQSKYRAIMFSYVYAEPKGIRTLDPESEITSPMATEILRETPADAGGTYVQLSTVSVSPQKQRACMKIFAADIHIWGLKNGTVRSWRVLKTAKPSSFSSHGPHVSPLYFVQLVTLHKPHS